MRAHSQAAHQIVSQPDEDTQRQAQPDPVGVCHGQDLVNGGRHACQVLFGHPYGLKVCIGDGRARQIKLCIAPKP
jgi:hypothetical protein